MVASTDSPQAIIHAEALTKIFRDFWHRPKVRAVNAIAFDVQAGEVFGLLGPNGSGKTTTLRMILGLLAPTRGTLSVFGRSPRDVESKARIGYLPEESCLYPYLTARETLNFYGRLFKLTRAARRTCIDQLLEMTGLQHAQHRPVSEFSKGMARRVGLAQALINDPDLIVLDEPTAGLDPIGCRQVKDLILTLAKRGKTVILSSHLLADVEHVCDRVAIMGDGVILVQGRVRDLLEQHDRCRLTFPALAPDRLEAVLQALRRETGDTPAVDHPTRTLEQFFIETIDQVRPEKAAPTGATPAEGVAEFLAGDKKDRGP
ncbi:MAG: ABC transporter ATP-binding protein [Kiritimatiellae bacterium]|nr:ABC transporter ATP-binding protein [Kiritimatiellia bacterium]